MHSFSYGLTWFQRNKGKEEKRKDLININMKLLPCKSHIMVSKRSIRFSFNNNKSHPSNF